VLPGYSPVWPLVRLSYLIFVSMLFVGTREGKGREGKGREGGRGGSPRHKTRNKALRMLLINSELLSRDVVHFKVLVRGHLEGALVRNSSR